jgi:hypothetical protein
MTMGWRASAARLGHAPADGSVMSRSPQRPARRPTAGTADAQAPGPGRHQVRLIFSALMLGILLAALDQTIVATALPIPPPADTPRRRRSHQDRHVPVPPQAAATASARGCPQWAACLPVACRAAAVNPAAG